MTPLGELRLAIPVAILTDGLPWYQAFLASIVGNMVPILFLVPALERISLFLLSFPNPLGRLLEWRTQRLRLSQGRRFQRYGPLALAIFVGIPLPLTGAWTGVLVAWAFHMRPRVSIPYIALGVLIAGGIVTGLTMSGLQLSLFLAGR